MLILCARSLTETDRMNLLWSISKMVHSQIRAKTIEISCVSRHVVWMKGINAMTSHGCLPRHRVIVERISDKISSKASLLSSSLGHYCVITRRLEDTNEFQPVKHTCNCFRCTNVDKLHAKKVRWRLVDAYYIFYRVKFVLFTRFFCGFC